MKTTLVLFLAFFLIGKALAQINNEYLKVGEDAPKIVGVDQFDTQINSEEILKNKKILLLFYRGNWCPYCKRHLNNLQKNLKKLTEKGLYVIVVTPEKVDKIEETTKDVNATFSIIYDKNNQIMSDYKVAFEVNKQNVPRYFKFTLKKVREYNDTNVLPVPATYLIDQSGKINFVHYDPDYSKRIGFDEILKISVK